jgi:integrase/recombinase XerD
MPRQGKRVKPRRRMAVKPPSRGLAPYADAELAHNRLMRYVSEYDEWLSVKHYSPRTVQGRHQALRKFIRWADERGLHDPREITRPMLARYQHYLFYYRKAEGKDAGRPLTVGGQAHHLSILKGWFSWMVRAHHILANPAGDLDLPKMPQRLPSAILSVPQVEAMLAEANPNTPQTLRDRALLEVLYATGMRRMEAATMTLHDADLARQIIWIRHGKGGRQRVVPLGERATAWLEKYLVQARSQLMTTDHDALFVCNYGEPIRPNRIAEVVKHHLLLANITVRGSTHLLRHACATHMLEGGADIRFIQQMLGHANLQTTEIYTHVTIDKLIAVHKITHPSRLQRQPQRSPQHPAPISGPNLDEARAALLQAIVSEEDDTNVSDVRSVP